MYKNPFNHGPRRCDIIAGGNRNQNTTEVLVILLDVNDNAPELPEPHELSWSVLENLEEVTWVFCHRIIPRR